MPLGLSDCHCSVVSNPGRAPALLDNLFQAVFMAPLFVLMEVMFMLGYRYRSRRR